MPISKYVFNRLEELIAFIQRVYPDPVKICIRRNGTSETAPSSMITEEIDCIQVEVLPIVIIVHYSLLIGVTAHHLDLLVDEPLVEHPRDRHPLQVV